MVQSIPILNTISNMLHRSDPRRQASIALARLLTRLDLECMAYDEGVVANRRDAQTRHVAIGIWLIPMGENQKLDDVDTKKAIPATTCDLRRHGIGVLTPVRLQAEKYIVAVSDSENVWRFFVSRVRHQSERTGGWTHLGLSVEKIWSPGSLQTMHFRNRVETAFAE